MQTTSERELREWMAFSRIEPWGDEWRMVGLIIAWMIALHAGKESRPEDHMPLPKTEDDDLEFVEVEDIGQTPLDAMRAFAQSGIQVVSGNVNH